VYASQNAAHTHYEAHSGQSARRFDGGGEEDEDEDEDEDEWEGEEEGEEEREEEAVSDHRREALSQDMPRRNGGGLGEETGRGLVEGLQRPQLPQV
jgi:hypothetical protein